MGKDRKGRECGKGISQRKDGKYTARYTPKYGKRREQHFDTLQEAKIWLADSVYEDRHNMTLLNPDITVDEWYRYWMDEIIVGRTPNTKRNYEERYKFNIKPVIGHMLISDVKPIHCQKVLNRMNDTYAGSTIVQTYITMGSMFKAALNNDVILKHPMNGVNITKPVRSKNDIRFLTRDEQAKFLETAERSHNYRQYALILETGLRTSELIGLTWDSIDWESRTLTVSKLLEYRHQFHIWRAGPPKTVSSYRTIPLTNKAYDILRSCYDERDTRKYSDELIKLDYIDRISGDERQLDMNELVFINFRTGKPAKNSSYDTHLYKLCDEAGIKRFCMHALRHTYATRAIEAGMQPKVLQQLLGHASIQVTMDKYVHVTEESMTDAVKEFEAFYSTAT